MWIHLNKEKCMKVFWGSLVALICSIASANSDSARKGPYGNTAETFGYNDFYIGMTFKPASKEVETVPGMPNSPTMTTFEHNGIEFRTPTKKRTECYLPRKEQSKIRTGFKTRKSLIAFDERANEIYQFFNENPSIKFYKNSRNYMKKSTHYDITVKDDKVVGLVINKPFEKEIPANQYADKLEAVLGKAKSRIVKQNGRTVQLKYQGDKILVSPIVEYSLEAIKQHVKRFGKHNLYINVTNSNVIYYAEVRDGIVEVIQNEVNDCRTQVFSAAKEIKDKEQEKVDIVL